MATGTYPVNNEVKYTSFVLNLLNVFAVLAISFWLIVVAWAGPPTPKIDDDRRSPLNKQVFGPQQDWRNPKVSNSLSIKRGTKKQEEDKGRIKSKRFKPYYYDPEKEGEVWDPYSTGSERNANPKPPTLFRFQF